MKIKEFYTDESKWSQKCFGRTFQGKEIDEIDDIMNLKFSEIKSLCPFAAICRFYPDPRDRVRVESEVKAILRIGDRTISEWNSKKERTFDEIRILFNYLNV